MWYQQKPVIKRKEVQEDNYNDDAFDDSDDEDSVDENAFDDSIDELLFDEFNSYLSQKSHDPVMLSRRECDINNNQSSKGKEVEDENYSDDAFDNSVADDSIGKNALDDSADELLICWDIIRKN
ncbi:hypothetical protein V6N12_000189 [Hibiscus sabdariffa]|uniref:Uncharacterized protein n=1 Tax=Hibiscus sabdariffa TaxID=183260 RepID=A0ABR2ATA6_9ROSI